MEFFAFGLIRLDNGNMGTYFSFTEIIPNAENNVTFERVKAAEIADRKLIRIELIRINLRSLAVDDLSELSRS